MKNVEYKVLKEITVLLLLEHLPLEFVKENVNKLLSDIIKTANESHVSEKIGNHYGDWLLAEEKNGTNNEVLHLTKWLRQEGVTDEDIRWYYNREKLRSIAFTVINNAIVLKNIYILKDTGLSLNEAGIELRKTKPIFVHSNKDALNLSNLADEDDNLPMALQKRVRKYIVECDEQDPWYLLNNSKSFSTFNAFIKHEIRTGKLSNMNNYSSFDTESEIDHFKLKIKEQENVLFGIKLYTEGVELLYSEDENIIYKTNKSYKAIERLHKESITRANELLEQVKEIPEMAEYICLFKFPPLHGELLDEMVQKAKVTMESYNELFPDRPHKKPLSNDEKLLLLRRASEK